MNLQLLKSGTSSLFSWTSYKGDFAHHGLQCKRTLSHLSDNMYRDITKKPQFVPGRRSFKNLLLRDGEASESDELSELSDLCARYCLRFWIDFLLGESLPPLSWKTK
jgi:hypothetical protein